MVVKPLSELWRQFEALQLQVQGLLGFAGAASQTEVDAGTVSNKYVAPLTFANAAKWDEKINHSLATAANDFLVASGAGVFVKKTLAEVQSLIGVGATSNWALSGSDIYYSGGNVSAGIATFNAKFSVISGSLSMLVGADNSAETLTNSTTKVFRIGSPHYTTSEEPMGILTGSSTSTANTINIGGGSSTFNAATKINFYTAADNITTTGTQQASLDSAGLFTFNTVKITGGSPSAGYYLQCDASGNASWAAGTGSTLWTTSGNNIYWQAPTTTYGYAYVTNDTNSAQAKLGTNASGSYVNLLDTSGVSGSVLRSYASSGVQFVLSAGTIQVDTLTASQAVLTNASSQLTTMAYGAISGSGVISVTGSRYVLGGTASVSISQATTSTSGYLSSTDWNTFNNKLGSASFNNLTATGNVAVSATSKVYGSAVQISLTEGTLSATAPVTVTAGRKVLGGTATIAINNFTSSTAGAVPNPGGTSGKFLRDDATWQTIAGAGSFGNLTGSGAINISATRQVLGGAASISISNFTSSSAGAVPNPSSSTGRFLKDDGTWSYIGGTSGFSSEELIITQEADQLIDNSISSPEISAYMAATSLASGATYAYKAIIPFTVNEAGGSVPCASFSMMGLYNTTVTYHTQKAMIFDNNGSYDYWVHFYTSNSLGDMSSPGSQLSGSEIYYAVLEGVIKTSGAGTLYIYFGHGLTGTLRTIKVKAGAFLAYRRVL